MSSVDNRIVQMTFDNAQFEQGVSKTMNTLNGLKDALDFQGINVDTSKIKGSLNDLNFNGINDAVSAVTKKFSVWGTIGDQILRNLGNAIFGVGSTLISSIIQPLTTGGWNRAMNIEKARFQIQGLGKDFDALSEDINYAVDGTAYTFDAAASVAAQLSASGVEAGDSMKYALRGISGVAAMTNSEYSDIGSIFTTVAGNGKLMSEQLNQLSYRGLNAAAILGEQLGVSESEVRDMTSKGKISFQMFAEAMDSAFGEHAKEANNTFQGSLANIRAAFSKIGQMFSQPVIQQMPDIFNAIRTNVNQIKSQMTDAIGDNSAYNSGIKDIIKSIAEWMNAGDFSWFVNMINSATSVVKMFKSVILSLGSALSKVFGTEDDVIAAFLSDISSGLSIVTSGMASVAETISGDLANAFAAIIRVAEILVGVIRTGLISAFNILAPIISSVVQIFSGLLGIIGRVVNEGLSMFFTVGGSVSDVIISITNAIGSTIGQGLVGAFNLLRPILEKVGDIFIQLFAYAARISSAIGSMISTIVTGFGQMTGKIFDFGSVFETFVSVVKTLVEAVTLIGDIFGNTLFTSLSLFSRLLETIAGLMSKFVTGLVEGTQAGTMFHDIFEAIGNVLSNPVEAIMTFLKKLDEMSKQMVLLGCNSEDFFGDFARLFGKTFGIADDTVENFIDKFSVIGDVFDGMRNAASKLFDGVSTLAKEIISGIDFSKCPLTNGSILNGLSELFSVVSDGASEFIRFVNPAEKVCSAITAIGNAVAPVANKFGEFMSGLFGVGKAFASTSDESSESAEILNESLASITDATGVTTEQMVDAFVDVRKVVRDFTKTVSTQFEKIRDAVKDVVSGIDFTPVINGLTAFGEKVTDVFSKIDFSNVGSGISKTIQGAAGVIANAWGKISGLFEGFDFSQWGSSLRTVGERFSDLLKEEIIPAIQNGIKTAIDKIKEFASDFGDQLHDLWGDEVAPKFKSGFDGFVSFITSLFSGNTVNTIKNAFETFFGVIAYGVLAVVDKITGSNFAQMLVNAFVPDKAYADTLGESVEESTSGIDINKIFEPITNLVETFKQFVQDVKTKAHSISEDITTSISDLIDNATFQPFIDWFNNLKRDIAQLAIDYFLIGVARTVNQAANVLKSVRTFLHGVASAFAGLGASLKKLGNLFNATALLELAISLKVMVSAFSDMFELWDKAFSEGKEKSMIAAIVTVGAVFGVMFLLLKSLSKQTSTAQQNATTIEAGIKGIKKTIVGGIVNTLNEIKSAFLSIGQGGKLAGLGIAMIGIAVAVRLLTKSIGVLGEMDTDKLIKGGAVVAIVVAVVAGLVQGLAKAGKNFSTAGGGFLAIAISMAIVVAAVKKLAEAMSDTDNFEEAAKQMMILFATLTIVMAVLNKLSGTGLKGISGGIAGIVALTACMYALSYALARLAQLNADSLSAAVSGLDSIMVVMLVMVAVFSEIGKNVPGMLAGAGAIVIISAGLYILSAAIVKLASVPVDTLSTALIGFCVILGVMTAALLLLSNASIRAVIAAASIVIVSSALYILAQAIASLQNLDGGQIGASMGALALGLIVIAAALLVISGAAVQALIGSAAILLVSFALDNLATAIQTIGSMPFETVIQGVIGLAVGLAILCAAGFIAGMPQVAIGLLAISVAAIALGAGCVLAGAGLEMFASALATLADAIPALADGIATAAETIAESAVSIGQMLIMGIVSGLVSGVSLLGQAILSVGQGLLNGIKSFFGINSPSTVMRDEIGTNIVQGLMDGMTQKEGDLSLKGTEISSKLKEGISSSMADYSTLGGDTVNNFMSGIDLNSESLTLSGQDMSSDVLSGLQTNLGDFNLAGLDANGNYLTGVESNPDGMYAAGDEMISGVTNAIYASMGTAYASGSETNGNYVSGITDLFGDAYSSGSGLVDQTNSGADANQGVMSSSGVATVEKFISGARSMFGNLAEVGRNIVDGVAEGIRGAFGRIADAAANMVRNAKEAANKEADIESPSKVFRDEVGLYLSLGVAEGIKKGTPTVEKEMRKTINSALTCFSDLTDALSDEYTPVITPVLDTSKVEADASRMNSYLSASSVVGFASTATGISGYGASNADISYQIQQLRSDMQSYTDAVMSRPQYSWTMGNATINSDETIQNDFTRLIDDLNRRAGMNVG